MFDWQYHSLYTPLISLGALTILFVDWYRSKKLDLYLENTSQKDVTKDDIRKKMKRGRFRETTTEGNFVYFNRWEYSYKVLFIILAASIVLYLLHLLNASFPTITLLNPTFSSVANNILTFSVFVYGFLLIKSGPTEYVLDLDKMKLDKVK